MEDGESLKCMRQKISILAMNYISIMVQVIGKKLVEQFFLDMTSREYLKDKYKTYKTWYDMDIAQPEPPEPVPIKRKRPINRLGSNLNPIVIDD